MKRSMAAVVVVCLLSIPVIANHPSVDKQNKKQRIDKKKPAKPPEIDPVELLESKIYLLSTVMSKMIDRMQRLEMRIQELESKDKPATKQ